VGFKEADGAEASLTRIANRMDSDDVLLFDKDAIDNPHELITPLRFFFDKRVYEVRDRTQVRNIVQDLMGSRAGDIYLVAGRGDNPPGFTFVDHVLFEQQLSSHHRNIPRDAQKLVYPLSFYRLNLAEWNAEALQSPEGLSPSQLAFDCCTGLYSDNGWTNGNAMIRNLRLPAGRWHKLILKVHGYRSNYADAEIKVYASGRELAKTYAPSNDFVFDLASVLGPSAIDLNIVSSTFVPSERGINGDTRKLGIDIDTLRIE